MINFSYIIIIIIIQIAIGQTKIENFMDNNLNNFFFLSFVSNKPIFILLVVILYFKIYKH